MKMRFFLIILLLSILLGAWMYLAHEHGAAVQESYDELSRLPIYAYVADSTRVRIIMDGLANVPALATVEHERGFQAAMELIGNYNLDLSDEMIADYDFPDIISITFEPRWEAVRSKTRVMDILMSQLDEVDIDSQSAAFSKIVSRLDRLRMRELVFSAFAFIMSLMLFVSYRLSHEMSRYLKEKQNLDNAVDLIRQKRGIRIRSRVMLIVPVALVTTLYYMGVFLDLWGNLAAWWTFALMALLSLIAGLINRIKLQSIQHDAALNAVELVPKADAEEEDIHA